MSLPAVRQLVLLRHAKSDYPGGVLDHDRPLSERGIREAAVAGHDIAAQVPPVEAVLCSTAVRTRQTLTHSGIEASTRFSSVIYEASPRIILREIQETADDVTALLVVGHAPGIPGLALSLADAEADPATMTAIESHFPTSAFTVLTIRRTWAELEPGTAALAGFTISRP